MKPAAVVRNVSVAQAKAHFSDCVREAESGRTVVITRHGKAAAALVPADALKQFERLRAAGPEAGLASLAGGWRRSDELVAELRRIKRGRGRRRRPPKLDD
jgi:prevent-host-death family protein